jgi:hypothetical protein
VLLPLSNGDGDGDDDDAVISTVSRREAFLGFFYSLNCCFLDGDEQCKFSLSLGFTACGSSASSLLMVVVVVVVVVMVKMMFEEEERSDS